MEIAYYSDYISENLLKFLLAQSTEVAGVPGLREVGTGGGLETTESLKFLCDLYNQVKPELSAVLKQRGADRTFIDERTKALRKFNSELNIDILDSTYQTVIGLEDGNGRIVVGPKDEFYCKAGKGAPIAPIPEYLQGPHVTLFGPPDSNKLCVNAMNAFHRKLKNEPAVISELLSGEHTSLPKWGADNEDSKTPLRGDLVSAGVNLTACFEKTIDFIDSETSKSYALAKSHLSVPIKRFPGLALPCTFLFLNNSPIPIHLYDFALHMYRNWSNSNALCFYVPKLENEEEARYIHNMIEAAEVMLHALHPEYNVGTVRIMVVVENPRAIFRVNEIMDALYPYFVGGSLGWHDYLASAARLFKEDPNYRIPVKADPNIVINYIKGSHDLLANVVGSRGGVKVGGMYGVLPVGTDIESASFQASIKGFIKDVITQLKRNLTGFWVAHPDFMRIGLALVNAWALWVQGDRSKLTEMVNQLLNEPARTEVMQFITNADIVGLDISHSRYARALLVADVKESTFIANNHPDEIRYNVFQSLQYLADWLSGNGCVALPAVLSVNGGVNNVPIRVMDDLATAERSRWEVWHELYHKRFSFEDFVRIAYEELHFIMKGNSTATKIIQVQYNERTSKWYSIGFRIMLLLMTNMVPFEFATELLMPFTVESIRNSASPWDSMMQIDAEKYSLPSNVRGLCAYLESTGSMSVAQNLVQSGEILDLNTAKLYFDKLSRDELLKSVEFMKLTICDARYAGIKDEVLKVLSKIDSNDSFELLRTLVWFASTILLSFQRSGSLINNMQASLERNKVVGASIAISNVNSLQSISLGYSIRDTRNVTNQTRFEIASLSKTLGSCFAIEYLTRHDISIYSSVNSILEKYNAKFRLRSNDVLISHLMSHSALNMHYVNGIPVADDMPEPLALLQGGLYGYVPVDLSKNSAGEYEVPGTAFHYSGGGFLLLQYIIELVSNKKFADLSDGFFAELGMKDFSFHQKDYNQVSFASGYHADGSPVVGGRMMHPDIAAGGIGSAHDVSVFLRALTNAFNDVSCSGPISHDTAVHMLHSSDLGSQEFMGANMGLGVFVAEAGANRIMLHQGANEGFRAIFIHCFSGPDAGKGFTILCNAELNGIMFVAEVAKMLFDEFCMEGVDRKKLNCGLFASDGITWEEVVNRGYKELIFKAFIKDLPDKIVDRGVLDPLARWNISKDADILSVTNEKFARVENLISPHEPVFDTQWYGRQGKVMDSWETERHNPRGVDSMVMKLSSASTISAIMISTAYHLGNFSPFVSVEASVSEVGSDWVVVLAKMALKGHSVVRVLPQHPDASLQFKRVRVSMYPDGGLSRVWLYSRELPKEHLGSFSAVADAKFIPLGVEVPKTAKPLTLPYEPSPESVLANWNSIPDGTLVNIASAAYGGKVLACSDEHYSPGKQLISPYPPIHMFDGMESARSRVPGHYEQALVQLSYPRVIQYIDLDFHYFRNNNPNAVRIVGVRDGVDVVDLVPLVNVKKYAGNAIRFTVKSSEVWSELKLVVYPDGGVHRMLVWAKK